MRHPHEIGHDPQCPHAATSHGIQLTLPMVSYPDLEIEYHHGSDCHWQSKTAYVSADGPPVRYPCCHTTANSQHLTSEHGGGQTDQRKRESTSSWRPPSSRRE
ncbi:hypothetical protein ARTSIC4J27_143 [Pseudarthrobacter siccitolerans]|uniref:Uncharacterized protein n=1 Tax=Pseudarthrobacter siccitolerans TaxID=861266 RepID=A0A024GXJ1_9MICC|nr:hypothetical protein ARTSIC4J27_143 [Pseudarthrobacter siccitolerans]